MLTGHALGHRQFFTQESFTALLSSHLIMFSDGIIILIVVTIFIFSDFDYVGHDPMIQSVPIKRDKMGFLSKHAMFTCSEAYIVYGFDSDALATKYTLKFKLKQD